MGCRADRHLTTAAHLVETDAERVFSLYAIEAEHVCGGGGS